MDGRVNRLAALANIALYDEAGTRAYIDGAPHIKHASLRKLYAEMVLQVYEAATIHASTPRVLDLGAGEGSVTLPFLDLGAHVTAVDISPSQLQVLREKCSRFGEKLVVRCEDIEETLKGTGATYDIIVLNSFLHHVPDYLSMLSNAIAMLAPGGQIFSFQDPLRYDSLNAFELGLSKIAYFSWRVLKGDVLGGLARRLRRRRGVFKADSAHDNAEYHVVRNGVDQDALSRLFRDRGLDVQIYPYFATQSRFWQPIGAVLGVRNYFAMIARSPHATEVMG